VRRWLWLLIMGLLALIFWQMDGPVENDAHPRHGRDRLAWIPIVLSAGVVVGAILLRWRGGRSGSANTH